MYKDLVIRIFWLGTRMLLHPFRTFRGILNVVQIIQKASKVYNSSYMTIIHHILLLRKRNFPPESAYRLGLLDPSISDKELSQYISKKSLKMIQASINPESWEFLTEDKSFFYKYCMAHDIPVPGLYAIFFTNTAGWSYNGSVLGSREDWTNFFDLEVPSEFVIKPARGVYGKSINIFSRNNKEFIDGSGTTYKAEELYQMMSSDRQYNCFVIQERMKNHPELVRLSNTQFLQTSRITTFIDNDGECRILQAYFKPIIGQNVIDNFKWGRTGNLNAEVIVDSGILEPAQAMPQNDLGIKPVFIHPETRVPFKGFQLPFWKEACLLVKNAAPKFLPLRTIGWDIALTPKGPYILEGNIWWDPPNLKKITGADTVEILTGKRSL